MVINTHARGDQSLQVLKSPSLNASPGALASESPADLSKGEAAFTLQVTHGDDRAHMALIIIGYVARRPDRRRNQTVSQVNPDHFSADPRAGLKIAHLHGRL